jgi:hypothetical protein
MSIIRKRLLHQRLLHRIAKYMNGVDFLSASYSCFGIQYHNNLDSRIQMYATFNDIENPKYNMVQKREQYTYTRMVFYQIHQEPNNDRKLFYYEADNVRRRCR